MTDFCDRHLFRVVRQDVHQRRGPTGHPNGRWGVWEQRQCIYCPVRDARWKRGINETSYVEACAVHRPTAAELARNAKLDKLHLEHQKKLKAVAS